jgi:Na+/H+ antiporter NhaC
LYAFFYAQQKSGGMYGFTSDVSVYANTPRLGQLACFTVGCFIFFDDYANCLLAGETMRPLLDILSVSREKLSFLVDATAAPVASLSPVSSWIGFEVDLIQKEIDKIIALEGTSDIGIKTSGFAVFLQSIKYRYYPIHMLMIILMLIWLERDFAGMLIAERKVRVYRRIDGGDGKGAESRLEGAQKNMPRGDTPQKSWNMVLPVLLLVFFYFFLLAKTGTIEGESQSFMDKIENSDSYSSMLWGTTAAVICTMLFYLLQVVEDGRLILPDFRALRKLLLGCGGPDEASQPRFLMTISESTESLLFGFGLIFPAVIILTLAWATGSIMVAVGADRLFASWIVGSIPAESLPTLSFVISLIMAIATGTSWGTMTILFPLILVPTYIASNGNDQIFYATVAGVLSGSVAGDHVSPISDTTVLSALASDCQLLCHVNTQAPYAVIVVIVCVLCGTIPIGYDAWPNMVGIIIGWILLGLFTYFICKPSINATGEFDIFTEFYIRYISRNGSEYEQLRADTIKSFNGELLLPTDETSLVKETDAESDSADDPAQQELEVQDVSDEGDAV